MTKDVRIARKAWELSSGKRAKYRLNAKDGMPFTVGFLVNWSKALKHPMGEHRAAAAIHELQRLKVLIPHGWYMGKHGYWYRLYSLAAASCSVRRSAAVKAQKRKFGGRGWWLHPLFGTFDGLPPPDVGEGKLDLWRSERHHWAEMERARA